MLSDAGIKPERTPQSNRGGLLLVLALSVFGPACSKGSEEPGEQAPGDLSSMTERAPPSTAPTAAQTPSKALEYGARPENDERKGKTAAEGQIVNRVPSNAWLFEGQVEPRPVHQSTEEWKQELTKQAQVLIQEEGLGEGWSFEFPGGLSVERLTAITRVILDTAGMKSEIKLENSSTYKMPLPPSRSPGEGMSPPRVQSLLAELRLPFTAQKGLKRLSLCFFGQSRKIDFLEGQILSSEHAKLDAFEYVLSDSSCRAPAPGKRVAMDIDNLSGRLTWGRTRAKLDDRCTIERISPSYGLPKDGDWRLHLVLQDCGYGNNLYALAVPKPHLAGLGVDEAGLTVQSLSTPLSDCLLNDFKGVTDFDALILEDRQILALAYTCKQALSLGAKTDVRYAELDLKNLAPELSEEPAELLVSSRRIVSSARDLFGVRLGWNPESAFIGLMTGDLFFKITRDGQVIGDALSLPSYLINNPILAGLKVIDGHWVALYKATSAASQPSAYLQVVGAPGDRRCWPIQHPELNLHVTLTEKGQLAGFEKQTVHLTSIKPATCRIGGSGILSGTGDAGSLSFEGVIPKDAWYSSTNPRPQWISHVGPYSLMLYGERLHFHSHVAQSPGGPLQHEISSIDFPKNCKVLSGLIADGAEGLQLEATCTEGEFTAIRTLETRAAENLIALTSNGD